MLTITKTSDFTLRKSVRIWSYSGPYSVRMRGNTDQNNSKYGHFSRSVKLRDKIFLRKFCRQNIMKKFHVSLDISMSGGRLHTPQSLMKQGLNDIRK